MRNTDTKKFFNLKFEFNWVPHILSGSLFHLSPQCIPDHGQTEGSLEPRDSIGLTASEHRPCWDRAAGPPYIPCSHLTTQLTPEPWLPSTAGRTGLPSLREVPVLSLRAPTGGRQPSSLPSPALDPGCPSAVLLPAQGGDW